MNLQLALNVLKGDWMVEPRGANALLGLFHSMMENGTDANWTAFKTEHYSKVAIGSISGTSIKTAPDNARKMREMDWNDCSVAVIPVSGPLMRQDGFCGEPGMETIGACTQLADSTPSVKTIIYLFDSPGGTVGGTEALSNIIANTQKNTIAAVAGTCCSAAYWLASSCDKIYALGNTCEIGSIGVMCSVVDDTEALNKKGYKVHTYYASQSGDKNKVYDAAKQGDGTALVNEQLSPLADMFIDHVTGKRASIDKAALTGKVYFAAEAIEKGLIDDIKNFNMIVGEAQMTSNTRQGTFFKNHNYKAMNLIDLKAQHPALYAEVHAEGRKEGKAEAEAAEKDRRDAWATMAELDKDLAFEGMASGRQMSQTDTAEFTKRAVAKNLVQTAKNENATKVETSPAAAGGQKTAEQLASEKETADFMARLKNEGVLGK